MHSTLKQIYQANTNRFKERNKQQYNNKKEL